MVYLDDKNEKVFLSLRGHEIIDKLAQEEHRQLHEIEEAKKSGAPNGAYVGFLNFLFSFAEPP